MELNMIPLQQYIGTCLVLSHPPSHFEDMVSEFNFDKIQRCHVTDVHGKPGSVRLGKLET